MDLRDMIGLNPNLLPRGPSMEREKTFANGQAVSSQRGDILTYYYKTGIVKATGTVLKDQVMDGKWLFYSENGLLTEVGYYKKGKKHGVFLHYDKLGQLVYEVEFSEGKEVRKHLHR